ncbi:cardiolipin synthase [Flagellimonas zhangzhouensis]|uniref:Cardiolipin synthase n=1 Tax=Flagellimonas zhangzhouensis TaxID=1073328 RepID=A0A1H2VMS4_9FLAO|nr:cardiolipin synthase [Allomuricauda zhangzhouensis]SDQ06799.1 cardiolipin synthase [Allomuricauda zhangzhouensis]SDW69632.1 cardiolipin synthase [Allomuricauda zhangzhouensis]
MNTTLTILYIITSIWAIGAIIYHGQRPSRSISWVMLIIIFPFLGALLYYLFGMNRRKFKFFNNREFERKKKYTYSLKSLDQPYWVNFESDLRKKKLNDLIKKSSGTKATNENKVSVLQDGGETFNTLFKAMEEAKEFIHLQYYILERGDLLNKMIDLFKRKINEGVEIRIIYDSLGSYHLRGRPRKHFQEIGVKIYPIMPIRIKNLLFSLNFRNHRKIVVIDNEVAFTGGVNISDKYIKGRNELGKWKDIHVKLEGPIVNDLHLVFLKDYYFASRDDEFNIDDYLVEQEPKGNAVAQVVAGGPDSKHPTILQQYLGMMNEAEHSIYIANPYFVPGEAFLQNLKIRALQGVEITLLVPKKSDSKMAKYAMFSQFEELLEVGVKIYLREDFSHSKIMIVDDDITSIGSGNFDVRSFELNYETNILIYDEAITKEVLKEYKLQCDRANLLHLEDFKNRTFVQRFLEGLFKFFRPLL